MNGALVPCPIVKSGTTNINNITYVQRGNVVDVCCRSASFTGGVIATITGLPKPIHADVLHNIVGNTGMALVGFIQYQSGGWRAYCPSSTADNFCNFTYLTDE